MGKAINILLIEDELEDVALVEAALAELETALYKIVHKARLEDALKCLYETEIQFDAVLLDLSLPDEEGLACLEKVRAQAPEVPVLVLTGREDEAYALQALQQGAQDYLFKREMVGGALARSLRYARERQQLMLDFEEMQDFVKNAVYGEQRVVVNALTDPLDTVAKRVEQLLLQPQLADAEREALEDIHRAEQEMKKWLSKLRS